MVAILIPLIIPEHTVSAGITKLKEKNTVKKIPDIAVTVPRMQMVHQHCRTYAVMAVMKKGIIHIASVVKKQPTEKISVRKIIFWNAIYPQKVMEHPHILLFATVAVMETVNISALLNTVMVTVKMVKHVITETVLKTALLIHPTDTARVIRHV